MPEPPTSVLEAQESAILCGPVDVAVRPDGAVGVVASIATVVVAVELPFVFTAASV